MSFRSCTLAALTATLFLVAQGASIAHYAGVEHVVCEAHGHVAHGAGHGHADGHDDVPLEAEPEPLAVVAWAAPESAPDQEHEHCELDDAHRPLDLAVTPSCGTLDLPPPNGLLRIASPCSAAGAQAPLLALAPKTSPPGAGLAAV